MKKTSILTVKDLVLVPWGRARAGQTRETPINPVHVKKKQSNRTTFGGGKGFFTIKRDDKGNGKDTKGGGGIFKKAMVGRPDTSEEKGHGWVGSKGGPAKGHSKGVGTNHQNSEPNLD